ncbi:mitochondrial ATP synthase g subunit-domain-containing protein [Crepidotus variabilis]|uniref:Mitochondrial ATP synthase g subunit-domain-containing protein n=1 Tax=Crepidotus variabilis TaxID=179855 RepID=A0A9P6E4K7_9AGAR|nr:mitochondrial ATP synthase g subunit-domain-containing protein [Crepidotus variabilis]
MSLPSSLIRHSLTRQAIHRQRASASKRFASSSTENAQQKAQEALASAQKNAGKLWESAQKWLGPLGERAGNLLGAYKQPLLYNLSVTREVLKQIYVKEGLAPPSLATFRETYASIWGQITKPGFVGGLVRSGDFGRVGIYGLQAYGIFKIGEIVGRRNLVGYPIH